MLAQLSDVHFAYPGTEIFTGVSWQVNPGDRVGLVGPNGAGKSTLLRLLSGQLQPEGGQVARQRGTSFAYLHQSQEFHGVGTLWDTLLQPFADLLAMREDLHRHEQELGKEPDGDEHEKHLARYGELLDLYTRRGGYTLESTARKLAFELGFTDEDLARSVETLSGGERGRVELAKVLLAQPDLLLLDEPTNHLDVEAVEHLEDRLKEWPSAFVLVSHDRYFLQAVCREIVDVEDGKLVVYPGGYDKYVVERAERHERMRAAFERQQEKIAKTEDFIRRNIAGQKTKQAQSRRKMLEKLDRLERAKDDWGAAGEMKLRFSTGDHKGGKEAVRAEALSVGYPGATPLIAGLDVTIYRGECVGIIGPNGAGKSTLMKVLLGKIDPLAGMVFRGHEVRVGYFDQKLGDLDEERSLIDEIRSVRGDFNEDVARSWLGRFRFSGDDAFRKVKGLSGGERTRLALGKLMLMPRNFLALDEPTNHLDIPAREVLEEALDEYDGTMIVVSHDRYFLDQVCTRLLVIEGGRVEQHQGNYSDLKARREEQRRAAAQREAEAKAQAEKRAQKQAAPVERRPAGKPAQPSEDDLKKQRIEDREAKKQADRDRQRKERRLAELEQKIAETEKQVETLREQLAGDHGGDWQRLNGLVAEERKLSERLSSMMGEWEKLGTELGA